MAPPLVLALAGACALAAGMGIGRFAYTPLLPYMQRDLELSIVAAGYIASANFLGYLIGALLAVRIPAARRSGWFAAGLAVSVLTTLAMAPPASPWLLGVNRTIAGMASAFVLIHGSAIALDAFARSGTPGLFSVMAAGVGIGITATAGLVEAMSRSGVGSATMWIVLGGLGAAFALPAFLLRDPPATAPASAPAPTASEPPPGADLPAADESSSGAPVAAMHPTSAASVAAATSATTEPDLPTPQERAALGWLTFAYGIVGFGYVITATFLVVIVRGNPDWRAFEMAVWVCVGLAIIPSNYFWLRVAQATDPYRAMTAAFIAEAIGVIAAVSGSSLALVMLGAVLLGGTFVAITALGLTTGRLLARGDSGPVVARMTAAFGLGQIIGPGLGGWLAERSGSFVLPSAVAALALVAGAAMVMRARQLAQPALPQPRPA